MSIPEYPSYYVNSSVSWYIYPAAEGNIKYEIFNIEDVTAKAIAKFYLDATIKVVGQQFP